MMRTERIPRTSWRASVLGVKGRALPGRSPRRLSGRSPARRDSAREVAREDLAERSGQLVEGVATDVPDSVSTSNKAEDKEE